MLEIMKNIENQILNDMVLNKDTIRNLNSFFKEINQFLKGSNDTEIIIFIDAFGTLNSNILNDTVNRILPLTFKLNFIEWLQMFYDNMELLYDILMLMDAYALFKVTNELKLILFKEIYLTGYFGYIALNKKDFLENFNYCYMDLKLISTCLNSDTLKEINDNITEIQTELYLMNNIGLKEILI